MSQRRDEIEARVLAISFECPAMLAAYERGLDLPGIEFAADPERALYEAFGFGRASFARVWLDPRVWARYLGLMARGRRPERLSADPLQLGGDVVVDAEGVIRWIWRSSGPEDRPSVDELIAALAES